MTGSVSSVVDRYLKEVLAPFLKRRRISNMGRDLVTSDVGERLQGLLSCVGDRARWTTLLAPGIEEATFYEPQAAALETRALVVIGVRNSLLEDLDANPPSRKPLAREPRVKSSEMRQCTAAAIEYFQRVELSRLDSSPSGPDRIFFELSELYPFAWRAFSHLAALTGAEQAYEPVSAAPPEALEVSANVSQGNLTVARLSGIEESLDPALLGYLTALREQKDPLFFSDCFKMITRHPRKLYRVVNFLLGYGIPLVTSNYLIAPDYVSRRMPLIRPAHRPGEIPAKLKNHHGVSPRHRDALRVVDESLG